MDNSKDGDGEKLECVEEELGTTGPVIHTASRLPRKQSMSHASFRQSIALYGPDEVSTELGEHTNGTHKYIAPNQQEEAEDEIKDKASLYIAMAFTFLICTVFTCVMPTSKAYLNLLGANDELVGWVIGFSPLLSALFQYPLFLLLAHVPLKTIYLTFTAFLVTSQALYAAAGHLNSLETLLAARACLGFVSGPQTMTAYVVRSAKPQHRSRIMLMSGVSIAVGMPFGCLLSVLVTSAKHGHDIAPAGTTAALWNSYSIIGWVSSSIALALHICVWLFFTEPPHITSINEAAQAPARKSQTQAQAQEQAQGQIGSQVTSPYHSNFSAEPNQLSSNDKPTDVVKDETAPSKPKPMPMPMPWLHLIIVFQFAFVVPFCLAGWNVYVILHSEDDWGWNDTNTGIFMVVVLVAVIPIFKLQLASLMSDRSGVLSFVFFGTVGLFLLFVIKAKPLTLGLVIFTIGSILLQVNFSLARGFVWALLASLVDIEQRPVVLSINAAVQMLGRGAGAIATGYLSNTNGISLLSFTSLFSWTVFAVAYYTNYIPAKQRIGVRARVRSVNDDADL